MISLLFNGHYLIFILLLAALVISLSFHEFGHAYAAKQFGDDTAERLGRLTLNPLAHIDPGGLLMVIFVGFGYAKPVPTDPRNFNSFWAQFGVAAAGPLANLIIAVVAVNFFEFAAKMGWGWVSLPGVNNFFQILIIVNLLLMLFNLLPIGPLDGHYILPYFLPKQLAHKYNVLNARFGMYVLLGLFLLSIAGIPIFSFLIGFGRSLVPYINFVS